MRTLLNICCCVSILLSLLACNYAQYARRRKIYSKKRRGQAFDCEGYLTNNQQEPLTSPRYGDNGFHLYINGAQNGYLPGRRHIITLQGTYPGAYFRGFAIRAYQADDPSVVAGHLSPMNIHLATPKKSCQNVMTHVTEGKKRKLQLSWLAPLEGCVMFSASIVQRGLYWFKDQGGLSFTICPAKQVQRNETSNDSDDCCSCGSATYRMTFYGIWSPQSHPKDYPAFSTHWSNVVGASHSSEYVMWEYGELSSAAIQKVAEWGWPTDLEEEIKAEASDTLSLIKTRALWPAYQPRNVKHPPFDTFEVDKFHPLVSLVSMLGPSPDWNVGISNEIMCTKQCGWMGERTYDLIPWDAGTDSGVSYESPNSPTRPKEPIRALTSSDHPDSPFYNANGGSIPPVAKIVIKRLSLSDDQCGESEPVTEDDNEIEVVNTDVEEEEVESCFYALWSPWSACGVTCGWGIKSRNRMLKQGDSEECDETVQKEICKGDGKCDNEDEVTVCLYSNWSKWAACSSSCGADAVRVRNRALKWPSEPDRCNETLKEMKPCEVKPCNASLTCMYSPWSQWMPCSTTCLEGTTFRKRFIKFPEENQDMCGEDLQQTSKCLNAMFCEASPEFDVPECEYGPWSEWPQCSVPCGIGQSLRKRFLTSGQPNCDEFQMETTKCMTSTSCNEIPPTATTQICQYADWSAWMPCSSTCGSGSTIRKRFLAEEDQSGTCEAFVMENKKCNTQACDDGKPDEEECLYEKWSRWMPCSASCGEGKTIRKRFLMKQVTEKLCDGFQMEQNRCTVPCNKMDMDSDKSEHSEMDCLMSPWSSWTECNCEVRRFRVHRRRIMRLPQRGGKKCGRRRERSRCDCK